MNTVLVRNDCCWYEVRWLVRYLLPRVTFITYTMIPTHFIREFKVLMQVECCRWVYVSIIVNVNRIVYFFAGVWRSVPQAQLLAVEKCRERQVEIYYLYLWLGGSAARGFLLCGFVCWSCNKQCHRNQDKPSKFHFFCLCNGLELRLQPTVCSLVLF